MEIKFDNMSYAFGGLDIVFLSNSEIQISGSHSEVSGVGITKGNKIDENDSFFVVEIFISRFNPLWGNKLFKLEINNNTIKSIEEQRDIDDPLYVKDLRGIYPNKNLYKYTFHIPGWLKSTLSINKFQLVFAAMENADMIIKNIYSSKVM